MTLSWKNSYAAILLSVALSGCVSNGFRDRMAEFIESDERATKPDRVRIETEYLTVPEEFYDREACPPPVSLTPVEIANILREGDYNAVFVAPHIQNNEECYLNMRRIEQWNDRAEQLNERNTDEEN